MLTVYTTPIYSLSIHIYTHDTYAFAPNTIYHARGARQERCRDRDALYLRAIEEGGRKDTIRNVGVKRKEKGDVVAWKNSLAVGIAALV